MKYLITILTLINIMIVSYEAEGQPSYSINGSINGLPDKTSVFLIHSAPSGGADTVQKTLSNGGHFNFNVNVQLEGELYFIKLDTSVLKLSKTNQSWVRLLVEKSNITMTGDVNSWPYVNISGSPSTLEYNKFLKSNDEIKKAITVFMNSPPHQSSKTVEGKRKYLEFLLQYFKEHMGSLTLPLILNSTTILGIDQKDSLFSLLPLEVKNSFYGEKLKAQLISQKLQNNIIIGKRIPTFEFEGVDGELVSITEVAKMAEYTLIDFWAYWCTPCRKDIPIMRKAFHAFSDRGFNIVSISTDLNKEKWKKAIKEDSTSWFHGMDIHQKSKDLFTLSAIPGYILIDKNSNIIALDLMRFNKPDNGGLYRINNSEKRLRGEELYEVIHDLIKKKPTNSFSYKYKTLIHQ